MTSGVAELIVIGALIGIVMGVRYLVDRRKRG